MSSNTIHRALFLLLLSFAASFIVGTANDPNILSDFILPPNTTIVGANYFTHTRMRSVFNNEPLPNAFTLLKATMIEFPALNGQGVSSAVLLFPSGAFNPLHSHPHGAELLFLLKGSLDVGIVDTSNKLYTQTLQPGDMFVFPQGLVHYQLCSSQSPAIAISAFSSANAETVPIPPTVFTTGIDEEELAKSFKTDILTIQMIKKNLTPIA